MKCAKQEIRGTLMSCTTAKGDFLISLMGAQMRLPNQRGAAWVWLPTMQMLRWRADDLILTREDIYERLCTG